MRAIIIAFLGAGLWASDASSCDGSPDILALDNWNIKKVDGFISGMDITVSVKSHAAKPFRMIDASYTFSDKLGRRIAGFKIDPDLKAKPGEIVSSTNGYTGSEMDRVPKMNREDVIVSTCVTAVVYDDGTQERFSRH